jgi:hypothetical protein
MTEAEWLACTDTRQMLDFLRGKADDRKSRLFAVACCRRIWHFLPNEQCQRAVEVLERFADGKATAEELESARSQVLNWDDLIMRQDFKAVAYARVVADAVRPAPPYLPMGSPATIREIFNPFRPVTVDPHSLTTNVFAIAQSIYNDRRFDDLPVLADALEDASCDNADILNHCRQPGVHVRGCWVVDLILGKE